MATLGGFDSVDKPLAAWLDSNGVKPFKEEFIRDHLSADPTVNDADRLCEATTVVSMGGAASVPTDPSKKVRVISAGYSGT
ncbi:hypothetical protein PG996_002678 [Apiospora saccharicola]|uniref:Uncharacterized protein n=1 Tax=Apiospora saccharicola TaxID=335842 RepID=A0ABR1WK76_9PEZI